MRNIYVWEPNLGIGKLNWYLYDASFPYIVQLCKQSPKTFPVIDANGKFISNCMTYKKQEIKFLHKKPLRYFIEKRQGK